MHKMLMPAAAPAVSGIRAKAVNITSGWQNGSGEDVLNGKACVKDKTGLDVTREFLSGAQKALQIAKNKGANYAILKARSPSCGCGEIYDGTFSGARKCGNGVAAELLMQHGIKVYTEETITEEELIKILQNK